MTDETKARLKKYAEAKKGRKNLASLDLQLGMIAFDKVQDADGERPKTVLEHGDGSLIVYDQGPYAVTQPAERVKCWRVASERNKYPLFCPWVRLKHAAPWQVEELAKRWPSRKVCVRVFHGPGQPATWETVTVHPVDVVVAWFRFLWPELQAWGIRAGRYMVGYTDGYVHDHPGVGARVNAVMCQTDRTTSLFEGELITDGIDGYGRALVTPAGWVRCVLNSKQDKWEVIG